MWDALYETIDPAGVTRFTMRRDGATLSYRDVIGAWREDSSFRAFFSETLAAHACSAYFWETRPVTLATLGDAFEFVLADSPTLAGASADSRPFDRALRGRDGRGGVVTFPNLGHDALLIVPRELAGRAHYRHLAAFVRGAPVDQQQALWAAVGRAVGERVGAAPLWVSTSGLGVYWLHIRLDSAPKYYTYAPYR